MTDELRDPNVASESESSSSAQDHDNSRREFIKKTLAATVAAGTFAPTVKAIAAPARLSPTAEDAGIEIDEGEIVARDSEGGSCPAGQDGYFFTGWRRKGGSGTQTVQVWVDIAGVSTQVADDSVAPGCSSFVSTARTYSCADVAAGGGDSPVDPELKWQDCDASTGSLSMPAGYGVPNCSTLPNTLAGPCGGQLVPGGPAGYITTWSSSNPDTASVSPLGVITCHQTGSTLITRRSTSSTQLLKEIVTRCRFVIV